MRIDLILCDGCSCSRQNYQCHIFRLEDEDASVCSACAHVCNMCEYDAVFSYTLLKNAWL